MKHIFILFALLVSAFSYAQPPGPPPHRPGKQPDGEMRKQIESLRVGVYSRVLNLSAEEAQKFWPVFNGYIDEVEKINAEEKELKRSIAQNMENMADAEIEKSIDKILALDQKRLDLRKKYFADLKKVLPMKKVILVAKAEREFKRELLMKFKEWREPED